MLLGVEGPHLYIHHLLMVIWVVSTLVVMNHAAVADFDGDGTPDMVLAGDGETHPISAIGIKYESE